MHYRTLRCMSSFSIDISSLFNVNGSIWSIMMSVIVDGSNNSFWAFDNVTITVYIIICRGSVIVVNVVQVMMVSSIRGKCYSWRGIIDVWRSWMNWKSRCLGPWRIVSNYYGTDTPLCPRWSGIIVRLLKDIWNFTLFIIT